MTETKKQEKQPKKRSRKKVVLLVCSAVLLVLVLVAGAAAATLYKLDQKYEFTVYPGVTVGEIDLSGMEYVEALEAVEAKAAEFEAQGVQVQYSDNDAITVPPVIVPLDASGYDYEVYAYDVEKTVEEAYAIGRSGDQWTNAKQRLWAWQYGRSVNMSYRFDSDYVQELLKQELGEYESPAVDANIALSAEGNLDITPESVGTVFDYAAITEQVEKAVQELATETVSITLQEEQPAFTAAHIEKEREVIEATLQQAPVVLAWEDKTWEFDSSTLGTWLTFADGELVVDAVKMEASLNEVKEVINIEPQEARWKVNTNEQGVLVDITELTPTQVGRSVDMESTAASVTARLEQKRENEDTLNQPIAVAVVETQPEINTENVNELGIKDLLGTGHSNMTGSPVNRRANIDRGIELLNGLLIAPDETFSLVQTIKPFTLENGYVAELVIKGNETLPEIGGGLCQVGTTTFRGAMSAGLDIIERRNHSYAVSYYSDDRNGLPGTDATIYDSSPDFKFLNDTGNYILLQTRRDNMDLYFDFWGVSDGRKAEFTPPSITGWIAPPPTKEIETTDLAPGQRKCTESAHAGTTASFDYIVNYDDGTEHRETFTSVYKPWQAVCLVGKQPDAQPVQQETTQEPVNNNEQETDATEGTSNTNKKNSNKKKDEA